MSSWARRRFSIPSDAFLGRVIILLTTTPKNATGPPNDMLSTVVAWMGLTFGTFGTPYAAPMVTRWWSASRHLIPAHATQQGVIRRLIRARDIMTLQRTTYIVGAQAQSATSLFVMRPLNDTHHALHVALWTPLHGKRYVLAHLGRWLKSTSNVSLLVDYAARLDDSDAF